MATRNLENITIHQFRGLKELELKNLGQINLLVGINNSGKTSVLEALSIYCDPLDLKVWLSTARQREDFSRAAQIDALRWLFYKQDLKGFIRISGDGEFSVKRIRAVCEEIEKIIFPDREKQLALSIEKVSEHDTEQINENIDDFVRKGLEIIIEVYDNQLSFFDLPNFTETYQLWESDSFWARRPMKKELRLPISFVTPTSHRSNTGQIKLLSEARFDNFKSDVLNLLNQMDRNISDIEILIPSDSTSFRADIYIQHKILGLVPLSSFGDGVRRLLHIALKLASVKGGILLIDELEATIHTEALQNSFQWLVKWCKELNVQLFATTHSLEAVDTLLTATEDPSDLVLYRLEPKENQTKVIRHDWSRLNRLREELGQEVRW